MSEPDWVQRNGTWVLSMVGVLGACASGLLVYMIKSRCTRIRCCGIECERDVLPNVELPAVRPQISFHGV